MALQADDGTTSALQQELIDAGPEGVTIFSCSTSCPSYFPRVECILQHDREVTSCPSGCPYCNWKGTVGRNEASAINLISHTGSVPYGMAIYQSSSLILCHPGGSCHVNPHIGHLPGAPAIWQMYPTGRVHSETGNTCRSSVQRGCPCSHTSRANNVPQRYPEMRQRSRHREGSFHPPRQPRHRAGKQHGSQSMGSCDDCMWCASSHQWQPLYRIPWRRAPLVPRGM